MRFISHFLTQPVTDRSSYCVQDSCGEVEEGGGGGSREVYRGVYVYLFLFRFWRTSRRLLSSSFEYSNLSKVLRKATTLYVQVIWLIKLLNQLPLSTLVTTCKLNTLYSGLLFFRWYRLFKVKSPTFPSFNGKVKPIKSLYVYFCRLTVWQNIKNTFHAFKAHYLRPSQEADAVKLTYARNRTTRVQMLR